MKKLKTLLAAAFVVFAACTKIVVPSGTVPINSNGEYAITFSHYPQTKALAASQSGTGYDTFDLFTWNSNNDTIMNPYTVHAGGTGYIYDDVAGQKLQYFSNTANSYKFLGVIPTTHAMKLENGAVTVEDLVSFTADDNRVTGTLSADSPEEFLFASTSVAKANYKDIVNLQFNHGNAVIYLGFSSNRTDTELIDYVPAIAGTPEYNDTTDTWFNLKTNTLVNGTSNRNDDILPELLAEIRSYYSIDGNPAGDYSAVLNAKGAITGTHQLRKSDKSIPAEYKKTVEIKGKNFDFFDGYKYLKDHNWEMNMGNGSKPAVAGYILINLHKNDYGVWTAQTFNWGYTDAAPQYTIVHHDAVPGRAAIEGVRMFTADSTATVYAKHIAHTLQADAVVAENGMSFFNRLADSTVVTYTLPASTTLNTTPAWSPTTFYSLPGDVNLNWLVVKLSYVYNGVTAYDVRVPIKLPEGGLKSGKYYKYELNITSTGNGTNDPNEASDEKDEIIIENLNPIVVNLTVAGYEVGADEKIII